MSVIHIKKAEMTSRQRVMTAFSREIPDRVPVDYDCNPGINRKVAAALGVDPSDRYAVKTGLGCDFFGVRPKYIGKPLFGPSDKPGITVNSITGIHTRWVEHESGGYQDYYDFPLAGADEEVIANWPMPDPDDYDYEGCRDFLRANTDKAIYYGDPGVGDIINSTGMLMGMEDVLVNLITDDEATLTYVKRKTDQQLAVMERMLDKYCGDITFFWMGEDLGTQKGPIIGRDLYLRNIRPVHEKFVKLAKHYGKMAMIHSCGSSSWAYNDFIEIGIDVVDTLQPEAADMAPAYLKKTYGDRLAFHGCISTAGPLAYGTVEDVIRDCRQTLDIMMPGGGYAFAPTHAIQDNSPLENVLAAYNTVHEYGVYQR